MRLRRNCAPRPPPPVRTLVANACPARPRSGSCAWESDGSTLWTTRDGSGPPHLRFRNLQIALCELFDVHVLERHDLDVLHEPRRSVHVPHPGVGHAHLEKHLTARVTDVEHVFVGEVEPAFGLDDVLEQTHDVAVLPIELELHIGLVVLKVFRAHRSSATEIASDRSNATSALSPRSTMRGASRPQSASSTRLTLMNDRRCSAQGPCSASASWCSGVM